MGWRCPVCNEDFGLDKKAQEHHMETEHQGAGANIEKAVRNIAEESCLECGCLIKDEVTIICPDCCGTVCSGCVVDISFLKKEGVENDCREITNN